MTLVSFITILWTAFRRAHHSARRRCRDQDPRLHGVCRFDLRGRRHAGSPDWIGYPLIRLNFDQQRYEADFRFSMVRLRENAENVAFYGGEAREFDTFQTRFARIVSNWWGIIRRRKKLTWFTTGYSQLAIIFPFVVAAPRYFDKAIQLGGLMQISSAFGQVQDSLSFIITSYTEIAEYQAVVQRLSGFREQIDEIAAEREAEQPIEIERGGAGCRGRRARSQSA